MTTSVPASKPKPAYAPARLVVMALIFPLFMAVALPGIYLAAFHQPVPNHMSVEIIGTNQQAQYVAEGLQAKAGKALDVTSVADSATARHDVDTMAARAAYNPATGRLYIASAGSVFAVQTVEKVFTEVAAQTKTTLAVTDLKPLPNSDELGITLLLVGLGGVMAGFTGATVVNLAAKLKLHTEIAVLAGLALTAGVITTFISYGAYGALNAHPVQAGLLVAAGAFVTSLVQSGGVKLIGPLMAMPGLLLFIMLGIPTSGATIPIDMVPTFFQDLHHVLPTSGLLDGLRRVIYFNGSGIWPDIMVLVVWAMIGGGLMWLASLRGDKPAAPSPLDGMLGSAPEAPATVTTEAATAHEQEVLA